MQTVYVFYIILCDVILTSASTDCFECNNVKTVAECTRTKTCNTGEICYTDFLPQVNKTLYSFGCRPETNCTTVVSNTGNVTNGGAGTLVGRSLPTSSCSQCCKEHHCNRHLCQQTYTDKECSDILTDCVKLERYAIICADTQRALSVCRRTCGLCSYVDGQWATWLEWSMCDVSCGKGKQTRLRLCTDPAPGGGGKNCQGKSDESLLCSLPPCPVNGQVHGHWSMWGNWGSCSTTCGIGMQRRDRTCSNPYPARFGDHCYGESRDDRLCVTAVCPVTDGSWNTWTIWTTCTASCGGGMKSHYRDCNNPIPSAGGKPCFGAPYEVVPCNQQACPLIYGGWSTWTSWTACTVSCGGGIKSHYRDCNNPIPSAGGKPCTGAPYEVTQCNQQVCPQKSSSFLYSNPVIVRSYSFLQREGSITCHDVTGCTIIAFNTQIFQEGTYYNSKSGEFTCLSPGVYVFTTLLVSESEVNCHILHNDRVFTSISHRGNIYDQTPSQTILHLQQGDKISFYCLRAVSKLQSSSTFGGLLVHADS